MLMMIDNIVLYYKGGGGKKIFTAKTAIYFHT